MKRFFCFTVRLAGSVRKSVNNVLASRRLALESLEDRLALSATPVPFASPPTDNEAILCCTAQLDTDYMEAIPIATEVLAAPPQRYSADGGAQTNENVDACNAVLADWSEDEDFFIEEAPDWSAAVDSETTFGYGETDEFLACAALEEDDGEVPDDALGDGCGSGCGDGCGSGCGDGCGGDGCGSGCDNGCSNAVGTIHLGGSGNFIEACYDGSAPTSTLELVVLQDGLGMVSIPAWMTGTNEFGYNFAITISNPGSYWNKSIGSNSDTFVWTKPANVTNAAATRDFTFNFIVYQDANNNGVYDDNETIAASESANLHIAYAEIEVSIAGEPFVPLTSVNNKAIVGQKIQARVAMDSRLTVQTNGQKNWSFSSNRNYTSRVKDYLISVDSGEIVPLLESDYHMDVIKYYEIQDHTSTIYCQVPVQWTSGGTNVLGNCNLESMIEIIVPESTLNASFSESIAFRYDANNHLVIDAPIIDFNASVNPIQRPGHGHDSGEINFLQTLQDNTQRRRNGTWESKSISGEDVLDTSCPFGVSVNLEQGVSVITPIGPNLSQTPTPVATFDRPAEDLTIKVNSGCDGVKIDLLFTMSLIYKPNGVDSIWVPLKRKKWAWKEELYYNSSNTQWILIQNSSYNAVYDDYNMPLQEWEDNVDDYLNW